MQKRGEDWDPTGVTSIFDLTPQDGKGRKAIDAGVLYTGVCGFGWRFASRVDTRKAPSSVFLDEDGKPIKSWAVALYFDPHFMRGAGFGTVISIETKVEHLIADKLTATPIQYHLPAAQSNSLVALGTFVYPSSAPNPTITFTVVFPSSLGLALPHPLESRLKMVLEESLTGKDLIDVKFYAFNRFNSGVATHPLPLFARVSLLQGFSDDLDNLLTGHGFSESSVVDLDLHTPMDSQFDGYGYESDSDFESDEEDSGAPSSSVPGADGTMKSPTKSLRAEKDSGSDPDVDSEKHLRRGRVVVLKDTAYRTWKALLYYLYTRQINFVPLRSENCLDLETKEPKCSAKSMYRLADKLGLDELKSSALQYIRTRLSEENILQEVFSSFTSMYPTVQTLEVEFLTSNFTPKATQGLKDMTREICEGQKPHCADTLFLILEKMGSGQ
ncbi:hypothetical protein C8R46DRAFT_1001806 [Mycena filopes]|nr:hypothetical protein C8R46DRAFT_1001806 [Mycena filopes]